MNVAPRLWALLLAGWLLGLAHLAVLPPYEGFDEIAHHASIRQIAATGTLPDLSQARIPVEIEAYLREGPSPYPEMSAILGGRGHDYARFFADEAAREAVAGLLRAPAPPFVPGINPNWQGQHPPLYYLALSPIERLLANAPLADRLTALRLASWSLAVTGFGIAAFAMASRGRAAGLPESHTAATLMAAWPFVMPMALPEFARMGNDSLCVLIAGGLTAVLLRRLDRRRFPWFGPLIGLLLGAGLMTKAFFLPIAAGALLFLLWLTWHWRDGALLRDTATAVAIAALMSGWWYLGNLLEHGDLVGGFEFIDLDRRGGFAGAIVSRFDGFQFLRGLAAIAASFVWGGSQTLARLPEVLHAVPVTAAGLPIAAALFVAWQRPDAPVLRLPFFLIAPFLAGLAYHVLVRIGLSGRGAGTGGWYLHTLAPAWAIAGATGWSLIRRHTSWRRSQLLLAAGSSVYMLAVLAMQIALFSGCAVKDAAKQFAWAGDQACPAAIYARLGELGHPLAALIAVGAAALILVRLAVGRGR